MNPATLNRIKAFQHQSAMSFKAIEFLRAHPDLPVYGGPVYFCYDLSSDQREDPAEIAKAVRALKRFGTVKKTTEADEIEYEVHTDDGFRIYFKVPQASVCTPTYTGRTVTRSQSKWVEVQVEVPEIEWDCNPVLALAESSAAAHHEVVADQARRTHEGM